MRIPCVVSFSSSHGALTTFDRSLTQRSNNIGPKHDPWGTPKTMSNSWESRPLIQQKLFSTGRDKMWTMIVPFPQCCSAIIHDNGFLWSTVSNAFLDPVSSRPVSCRLPRLLYHSSLYFEGHVRVECNVRAKLFKAMDDNICFSRPFCEFCNPSNFL